jgi:hypothetical protein
LKIKPLILPAINFLLWGFMAWMGFGGEVSVETRVGSVILGQVEFYVVFPLIMLSVAVIPGVLLSQTKWHPIGSIWSSLALLLILPYACFYGGGV